MKQGFTLIELLITIAIIGVLASIGFATYPSTQKLARDARRKSDMKQYQTALESYANGTDGIYLTSETALTIDSSFCTSLSFASCIFDPNNTSPYIYKYISTANGLDYVLWAKLESKSTATYWTVCSNGTTGESTTVSSNGVCPI